MCRPLSFAIGMLTHVNQVSASPTTTTPGHFIQSTQTLPTLHGQQLTCISQQRFKEGFFRLPEIKSPAVRQSQRIHIHIEQSTKLERHPAAWKTIDLISITPLPLPPPSSSFLGIHGHRQQQQCAEKSLSSPFPSLFSFFISLSLSFSSVSAGQKPSRVYYSCSLHSTCLHYTAKI